MMWWRLHNTLASAAKDENMIAASNRSRLTHINGFTSSEPVLEGAGQVSPSEISRRRRDSSGHVKKGVWSVTADPGRSGFDGASINHLSDRGLISTL